VNGHLPDPLVAADVDLRNFGFMPLWIAPLRQSKAWLRCKRRPELAFYLMNLWTRVWHEVPAGSIEDDDDVLADAAGIAPADWPALREEVMRGWVKCSDGRLYHSFIADLANTAWQSKEALRQRMQKAREAKAQRNASSDTGTKTGSTAEADTGSMTDPELEPATALKGEERIRRGDERRGEDKDIEPPKPPKGGKPKPDFPRHVVEAFDAWWPHYPKHVEKRAALKAFATALNRTTLDDLIAGAQRYASATLNEPAEYTKNPATWLNADCWLDDPSALQRNGRREKPRNGFAELWDETQQRLAERDLGQSQPPADD
jgi:hypothetical protein